MNTRNRNYPVQHDAGTIPLGTELSGDPFNIPYRSNVLVVGEAGSGKGVVMNDLAAGIAQRSDAQLVYVDVARLGVGFQVWLPRATAFATDFEAAVRALNEVRYLIEKRLLEQATGDDVFVFVDEFAYLLTAREQAVEFLAPNDALAEMRLANVAARDIEFIASYGPSVGVFAYLNTHRTDANVAKYGASFSRVMLLGRSAVRPEISKSLLLPAPVINEPLTGRGVLHTRGVSAEVFDAYYIDHAVASELAQETSYFTRPLV